MFGAGGPAGVLAVFAIEQVADGSAAGFVDFLLSLQLFGAEMLLGSGFCRFLFGALRTAIGEAGLVWPELEFFRANDADFDWERHTDP